MNIITLIVALLQMRGSSLTGNPWTDVFLDKMVGIESWFYHVAWWVWGVALAVFLIVVIVKLITKSGFDGLGLFSGCVVVLLLLWPLAEWFSLFLISGMANNFNATGITNMVPFILYLLFYLPFGTG